MALAARVAKFVCFTVRLDLEFYVAVELHDAITLQIVCVQRQGVVVIVNQLGCYGISLIGSIILISGVEGHWQYGSDCDFHSLHSILVRNLKVKFYF